MKNAFKLSKKRSGRSTRHDNALAAEVRRERRQYHKLFAPPDVPHRRREARRWLDELSVRISNPPITDRRPGERLFATIGERFEVADALRGILRKADPELYRAVQRIEFEDSNRSVGLTISEWKAQVARKWTRLSKVRAEMRRAGLI